MNRKSLAEALAVKQGLTEKKALEVLDAVLDTVSSALASGEPVRLHGFGTFEVRDRPAREGVNPQTGQKVTIRATKVPKFRAGKRLKETVRA